MKRIVADSKPTTNEKANVWEILRNTKQLGDNKNHATQLLVLFAQSPSQPSHRSFSALSGNEEQNAQHHLESLLHMAANITMTCSIKRYNQSKHLSNYCNNHSENRQHWLVMWSLLIRNIGNLREDACKGIGIARTTDAFGVSDAGRLNEGGYVIVAVSAYAAFGWGGGRL